MRHVVEGLKRALSSDVEVVLHDVSKPKGSVVAIANGAITDRTVGSSIISGPFDDLGLSKLLSNEGGAAGEACTIVSDYRSRAPNGNQLESTSMIFRDHRGRAYAALCVNADRSKLRHIQSIVSDLLSEAHEPQDHLHSVVRWRQLGVFIKIFAELARKGGMPSQLMIDATTEGAPHRREPLSRLLKSRLRA